MKCPHCNTAIRLDTKTAYTGTVDARENKSPTIGLELKYGNCPECENLIVLINHGVYLYSSVQSSIITDRNTTGEVIYPKSITRKVGPEVPEIYAKEFYEACLVLPLSAKSSAALSRRLLQNILREEYNIKYPTLAREIEAFIKLKNIPSYLSTFVPIYSSRCH